MTAQTNWLFIVISFVCLLGFLTSAILFFLNRNQSLLPRILAAIIFCLAFGLVGYGLYVSGEFLNFPHLWRSPVFPSLCIAPLSFIYVNAVLRQAYKVSAINYLLFLPAILYTMQFIPFYLLSAEDKLPFIKQALSNKVIGIQEKEGLLPPVFAIFFRTSYSLTLIVYTAISIWKWKNTEKALLLRHKENRQIFLWLVFLVVVLFLSYASLFLAIYFQSNAKLQHIRIPTWIAIFALSSICVRLFIQPELLYGFRGWVNAKIDPITSSKHALDEQEAEARRLTISFDQGLLYKKDIEKLFQDKKPFLKPRYALKDLSNEMKIPSYLLSAFINQEYGKNFNEFVNDQRVAYLIALAHREPDYLEYNLAGLGKIAGFNSRSSFISAVKKTTGKMPSEVFAKQNDID